MLGFDARLQESHRKVTENCLRSEQVHALQDILADTLEDTKFYESKQVLESRAVGLMQAKIALLSSAAEAGLQNLEKDHSDMTRQLRLEIADRECQVSSCSLQATHQLASLQHYARSFPAFVEFLKVMILKVN